MKHLAVSSGPAALLKVEVKILKMCILVSQIVFLILHVCSSCIPQSRNSTVLTVKSSFFKAYFLSFLSLSESDSSDKDRKWWLASVLATRRATKPKKFSASGSSNVNIFFGCYDCELNPFVSDKTGSLNKIQERIFFTISWQKWSTA